MLVALRTFGHFWTKSRVKLHIDNKAVVFALRNGRIRDTFMQSVAKSLWLLAAIRDIQLEFSHISGVENIKADILSRLFQDDWCSKNLTCFKIMCGGQCMVMHSIQMHLCNCLFICCFTSRSTARVILRGVVYRWRKPVHTAL